MIKMKMDERLKAIADMVQGSVMADVGSDHAYVPIWLYLSKKITKAYALDISENSINKIKANIKRFNITPDCVVPVLSDGLLCFKYDLPELTDVVISGMGGENIAEIISNTNINKIRNANFILQPNSKIEILREFLYKNKFDIICETVVEDDKRLYNIINAKFNGVEYNPKPMDIIIGKSINLKYINKITKKLEKILIDLNNKGIEKYNIKTEFGYYDDIENFIAELKEKNDDRI